MEARLNMSKSKEQKEREAKKAADRVWMNEQEARKDGPWLCGLRGFTPEWTRVEATCLTEPDAERYMNLRCDQNGGCFPHILGHQEMGWWTESKCG